jgi:hypothetical protein
MATPILLNKLIAFPKDLVDRANRVTGPLHTNFAHLVREGLRLHLDQLEESIRQSLARQDEIRQRKAKLKGRGPKQIKGALDDLSFLGRKLPSVQSFARKDLDEGEQPVVAERPRTADDELYERAARTLLGVRDPEEARRRAQAALALVQSERRVTAPSESEILTRLDENLRRLRNGSESRPRTVDDLTYTIIDVDKVKTVGETGE